MTTIISIPHQHIKGIKRLGIHFTNQQDDADFLPFSQCYESLYRFVASEQMPMLTSQFTNQAQYWQLLNQFNDKRVVGIYDNLNRPDQNSLAVLHTVGTQTLVYRFEFATYAAYQDAHTTILSYGWHIFDTTDLIG